MSDDKWVDESSRNKDTVFNRRRADVRSSTQTNMQALTAKQAQSMNQPAGMAQLFRTSPGVHKAPPKVDLTQQQVTRSQMYRQPDYASGGQQEIHNYLQQE